MPASRSAPDLAPSVFHQHLMAQTDRSHAYDQQQGDDLKKWQRKLRRKFRDLLGLTEMDAADRSPLRPRSLWRRETREGVIEKVIFNSQPKADVVAFVCIPHDAKPPHRFVICVQGHTTGAHVSVGLDRDTNTDNITVEGDRDFALRAMREGFAAIAVEMRSFGERGEKVQKHVSSYNTCHDAAMHAMMLGRSLAGERVYDIDRTIDYLEHRGDVDMKRVGIMGNSGGGTMSLFSAATLPRIAYAMPSCYFCTFQASLMSIYHCACNFVPGLYPVADMSDLLGCFAPKPVVAVAGKQDAIFPIKATRKAFRDLKQIYAAAGAPDMCELVVGPEGHRFYADLAWPKLKKLLKKAGI